MDETDKTPEELDEGFTVEAAVPTVSTQGKKLEQTTKQKAKTEKQKSVIRHGLKSHWAIKATVITFVLSAFFSFVAQMTATAGNIIVVTLLLLFLIVGSILTDGIGVAVAACELPPLMAMASKKVPGSKMAIKLVKNAEIVSNICNDVIGDIFGILSGSCTVVIVGKILLNAKSINEQVLTIGISAIVSAMIVGGKAFLKNYAINKSKEFIMLTARVLSVFVKENKTGVNNKKHKN